MDPAAIRRRLAARMDADFVVSEGRGQAIGLAASATRSGYSRVIAVGGDGTVGEVATGLHRGDTTAGGTEGADGRRPELGLIPVGTGNDLARSLGLPLELEAAAEVALRGRGRALDLIVARGMDTGAPIGRVVTNAAVAGFCGRIGDRMSPAFRRRWGPVAYPLAALGQLRDLRPYAVRLAVDGRTVETRALMVIVANSRFAGGQIPMAPDARTDDGLLDLVILKTMDPMRLATLVPRVFRGTHADHPGVRIERATTVQLESTPGMWINLDGDTWHTGPSEFRLHPSALRVLVP